MLNIDYTGVGTYYVGRSAGGCETCDENALDCYVILDRLRVAIEAYLGIAGTLDRLLSTIKDTGEDL